MIGKIVFLGKNVLIKCSLSRLGEIRVPKAFVLINVESGSEEEVLERIKKSEGVEEAYYSYGVYDIIAKIKAETMERLREAVSQKMRAISKVRSTLTLIILEE